MHRTLEQKTLECRPLENRTPVEYRTLEKTILEHRSLN